MSLDTVKADLAVRAPDLSVMVTDASTATVQLAAEVHGVAPGQIAKTLAILPVVTYVGLSLGPLVGGAVVTEIVFSMPGVGRLFVGAISAHDFPVMLAVGILVIFGVMAANLLSDIVYVSINRQASLG